MMVSTSSWGKRVDVAGDDIGGRVRMRSRREANARCELFVVHRRNDELFPESGVELTTRARTFKYDGDLEGCQRRNRTTRCVRDHFV